MASTSKPVHPTVAYKLLLPSEYDSYKDEGIVTVYIVPVDANDGYIHMSSAETVVGTFEKYFGGRQDVVLLEVDLDKIEDLRWEESRGGALFPHAYGKGIEKSAVNRVQEGITLDDLKALSG